MIGLTEMINKVISLGAEKRMTDLEFIEAELSKWLSSSERQMMIDGERYYNGDHDILDKTRTYKYNGSEVVAEGLPNNRIVDNQYRKMVIQKTNYLLGKPMTVTTDSDEYQDRINKIFNRRFDRMFKAVLRDAINGGKTWLFVGLDENGKLKLRNFKSYEVKPFWADAEHTILDCAVRIYPVCTYEGTTEKIVEKVEIFDSEGIHYFERSDKGRLVKVEPYDEPYITISVDDNIEGFNWSRIPLICCKYNESELPLIKAVKPLQDGINKIESAFEDNMEEDARNTILVLVNYDGQDLAEFRKNLATYGAVKVRQDGGGGGGDVKTLQVAVNADNYRTILKIFKEALVENAMGYDAKDDRLSGNPNEMNIQSMYSDIDVDADNMELELQAALEELMWFVNCHLANTGNGDWSDEYVEFTFNRNTRVDEAGKIANIRNSLGIVSLETLLANHPYVDDVKDELERLAEERQAAVDDMGFERRTDSNGEDIDE